MADLLLLPQDRAEDLALRLPLLGRAYADCGDTERAETIYHTLQEMARTEHIVGFNLATIAVGRRSTRAPGRGAQASRAGAADAAQLAVVRTHRRSLAL